MNDTLTAIENASEIAIFGAQPTTYGIFRALRDAHGRNARAFLVSSSDGNPSRIEDVPVVPLDKSAAYGNCLVVVAIPAIYHKEVGRLLTANGLHSFVLIDSAGEYAIRAPFFRTGGRFALLRDEEPCSRATDIRVFMAKCHVDKPLTMPYAPNSRITSLQTGAALTEQRIAEVTDDAGCSLSSLNRDYCELTATYWIWKNVTAEYKGLFHYRRVLDLSESDWLRIPRFDAVLPFPFLCWPDASAQYKRYVSDADFTAMMTAIQRCFGDYYESAREHFTGAYLYNNNIVIARERVFNEYCAFLFTILEDVASRSGYRSDRYLGYLGELLTSLYFTHNALGMRIAHAPLQWLV